MLCVAGLRPPSATVCVFESNQVFESFYPHLSPTHLSLSPPFLATIFSLSLSLSLSRQMDRNSSSDLLPCRCNPIGHLFFAV